MAIGTPDKARDSSEAISTGVATSNSTVGILLSGTRITSLISGGPAHQQGSLEQGDEIISVDGAEVDESNVKDALRGTDVVGSHVRITVRRGDSSEETVTLRRSPMSYVYLIQVYYELYEQLKVSVRDTGGSPDLLKRIGSKIREIDRYYSHVVDELESERFLLSRRVSELEGVAMRLSQSSPPSHDDAVGDARAQLEISRAAEKQLRDQLDAAKGATAKAEESAREAARRSEAELSRNRAEVQQSIIHQRKRVARLREQLESTEKGSDVAKTRGMEATVQSALLKTKSLETQVQQLSADNARLLSMREREKQVTPPPQPGPSAEEAQQTIQELKDDGARLQGRIRGLEEEVTRLRLQRGGSPEAAVAAAVGNAAEEAQKRLIVEAEGLRAQLNSTAAGSRRLAEQLAKAQGDADAFASERDALQMEVELLRKASEEALGDACGPERVLEQRIVRSEAAAKEAATRADQAETKVMSLATSLEECQSALSKARASSQRARRDEEAGEELRVCKEQLQQADVQLEEASSRASEADSRAAESAARLAEAIRGGHEREKALRGEVSDAERSLREAMARAGAAENELASTREEVQGAKAVCERLRRDLQEARGRAEAKEREREAELRGVESSLREAREELTLAKSERDDAIAAEARLRSMAGEAHGIAEGLQETKERVEGEMKGRIAALEEELSGARSALRESRAHLQAAVTRENSMSRGLMQAEDTSRSLQARARSLEGELAAARGKADESKKALSQANAALERSECSRAEERDEASREREGLVSKCQGLVDRVETLQARAAEAASAEASAQDAAKEMGKRAKELEAESETLRSELARAREEHEAHGRAREWQLQATKERLKVAEERAARACAREEELVGMLEATEEGLCSLQRTSVEESLHLRKHIGGLKLRAKGLEDDLDNERRGSRAVSRLLMLSARELAAMEGDANSALNRERRRAAQAAPHPDDPLPAAVVSKRPAPPQGITHEHQAAVSSPIPASPPPSRTATAQGRQVMGLSPRAAELITSLTATSYTPSGRGSGSGGAGGAGSPGGGSFSPATFSPPVHGGALMWRSGSVDNAVVAKGVAAAGAGDGRVPLGASNVQQQQQHHHQQSNQRESRNRVVKVQNGNGSAVDSERLRDENTAPAFLC